MLDALHIEDAALVTHDIGNMVGYAFVAQYPARVTRWVAMDAPLPGIGPWEILKNPLLWHFNFRGPDAERLVAGRERIYLDRFYNELSADPKGIDEADAPALRRALRSTWRHALRFRAVRGFAQDAIDNKELVAKGKLTMPVLAIGAEKSFGTAMADDLRFVANNVTGVVIPNSGHWLMEEQPTATIAAVRAFLDPKP